MKDLDFDELDRAVNSLMTSAAPRPAEPKNNDSPTARGDIDVSATASEDKTQTQSPQTITVAPPPAIRRGGRFMDVVHPSSDMAAPTVPKRVSREGVSLTPPSRAVPPRNSQISSEQSPSRSLNEVAPQTGPVSEWPDPIEFNNRTQNAPQDPQSSEDVSPTFLADTDTSDTELAPLQSPFLSDTKVEKRPLGAFTPGAASDGDAQTTTIDNNYDTQLPQSDTSVVIPDELKDDIMAIESDSTNPKTIEEAPSDPAPANLGSQSAAPGAIQPTSIPRQYTEEQSSTPVEHAAIYDTQAYHQPLAHPAKHKSGWLWVILTILLLIAGAGAGAAVYFFVL